MSEEVEIDFTELDEFTRELENLQKEFPRQSKRLIGRIGSRARVIVRKKAKSLVNKKTGNYLKSIKRGKIWEDKGTEEFKVRVYSAAPHAHLIEKGHRIVGKDGTERGFKKGYRVFDEAGKDIEKEWDKMAREEFDKIVDKL